MSTVIDSIEQRSIKKRPRFDAGDRVRVHFQVVEGTRRRTQVFEGIVIKRQGGGIPGGNLDDELVTRPAV